MLSSELKKIISDTRNNTGSLTLHLHDIGLIPAQRQKFFTGLFLALQTNLVITHLSLQSCQMTDHEVAALAKVFVINRVLISIDLRKNPYIGSLGVTHLAMSLENNYSILCLRLDHNNEHDHDKSSNPHNFVMRNRRIFLSKCLQVSAQLRVMKEVTSTEEEAEIQLLSHAHNALAKAVAPVTIQPQQSLISTTAPITPDSTVSKISGQSHQFLHLTSLAQNRERGYGRIQAKL